MPSGTRRAQTSARCRSAAMRCSGRCGRLQSAGGREPWTGRNASSVELRQASSLLDVRGGLPIHGGTEVVPLLRAGLLAQDDLVDVRGVIPSGVAGRTIGAGTTLAALEADPAIPAALREACRLAASPQIRNVGSLGGNLLQATRCWYWRLDFPC